MASTRKRVIKALNISLVFDYKMSLDDIQSEGQKTSTMCELEFIMPRANPHHSQLFAKDIYFHVHFVNQTCTPNNYVLVSSRKGHNMYYQDREYLFNRLHWTGCELEYDPLPVYINRGKQLFVVLHLNDFSTNYSLRIDIVAGWPIKRDLDMEIIPLSTQIGRHNAMWREM